MKNLIRATVRLFSGRQTASPSPAEVWPPGWYVITDPRLEQKLVRNIGCANAGPWHGWPARSLVIREVRHRPDAPGMLYLGRVYQPSGQGGTHFHPVIDFHFLPIGAPATVQEILATQESADDAQ